MRWNASNDSGRPAPFRPTRGDLVLTGAILLLAVSLALLFYRPAEDASVTAVVSLDGIEQMRIDLDTVREHTEYPIDAPHPLVIATEPGRVCVLESSCPGNDCVLTGWISAPGSTVVCLPNRLVITLESGAPPPFDAVTG